MATGYNDIFISYGRGNEHSQGSKAFSLELYNRLEAKKFDVWLDNQDIPHAVDFQKEINEGIKSSDNFIFIISPHAVASLYCMREIELAVELNKRIIPIMHILPEKELMEDSLHPIIKKLNWIYFDNQAQFDNSLGQLEQALVTDQAHLSKHTDYTTKAVNWRENNRNNDLFLFGSALKDAEKWMQEAKVKTLNPSPSNIQEEYITKSRKYNNFRTFRRVAAVITFILVSSALSLALYYSQQERIAANEALKNIQLANSNELIAKANSIQCDESFEVGLMVAALAYEADTTNEIAKAALYDAYYKTFRGEDVEEKALEGKEKWAITSTGKGGGNATLLDANTIGVFGKGGHRLATFKSDEDFTGVYYDVDKDIIYAKTAEGKVVSYHLNSEWVLKNMHKKEVPALNNDQLEKFGIEKELYQELNTKIQKFKQAKSPSKPQILDKKEKVKERVQEKISQSQENTQDEKSSNNNLKDSANSIAQKSVEEFTEIIKNALNRYQTAQESDKLNEAGTLFNIVTKAYSIYPDNASINRVMVMSNAFMANEYALNNMPDSALILANKVLTIDPRQEWVNKIKVTAHLYKNEFDKAVAISKPLLDKKYPPAKRNITYSDILMEELQKIEKERTLNSAQKKFKSILTVIPIEVTGFLINDRSTMTTRQNVSLKIYATGAKEMMLSNTPLFNDKPVWEQYKGVKDWKLLPGQGKRTVYVKFRNKMGNESKVFQQSILLSNY